MVPSSDDNSVVSSKDVSFTIEFNITTLLLKGNVPEKTQESILVTKYREQVINSLENKTKILASLLKKKKTFAALRAN